MNCRSADFIGYSIFLEIFLEMRFYDAFGVPEKSVFTRLFRVLATAMLANFQVRLVMTVSQHFRKAKNSLREIFWSLPFLQRNKTSTLFIIAHPCSIVKTSRAVLKKKAIKNQKALLLQCFWSW